MGSSVKQQAKAEQGRKITVRCGICRSEFAHNFVPRRTEIDDGGTVSLGSGTSLHEVPPARGHDDGSVTYTCSGNSRRPCRAVYTVSGLDIALLSIAAAHRGEKSVILR